ncbi:MAG: M43 family zinc metalloprotease, partial [Bacteroidota bacterium]
PMQLTGGLLGYATFPSSLASEPHHDGIVLNGQYTGGPSCASSPYNLGRTATHEVGHWLGLYHTFSGGCAGMTPSDCAIDGDEVCDTPPVSSSSFGCPSLTQNTCSETPSDMIDQTVNFMDYVDDACMVMFSQGQVDRMHATLNTTRANLWSTQNHGETGCGCSSLSPCTPVANFNADNTVICPNQTVNFTDISVGPATGWAWIFSGGTPSSATTANPSVTYTTPGTYDVTLTVTNSLGNANTTVVGYVTVVSATPPPVAEGFESTLPSDWQVSNVDGQGTWDFTSAAASSGSQSFWVNNWDYNANGTSDFLSTRLVDLTNYGSGALFFDYAYQRASFEFDTMRVWCSSDCGETWNLEWEKGGGDLSTVGGVGIASGYTPAGPSDFVTDSIDLTNYFGFEGFKARFENVGYEGNNLYLDNINLSALVGRPDPSTRPTWQLDIAPNPFENDFQVLYSLPKKASITFSLVDLKGRVVYQVTEMNQSPGSHELVIPSHVYSEMSSGIYMLRGTSELGNIARKVVKMN